MSAHRGPLAHRCFTQNSTGFMRGLSVSGFMKQRFDGQRRRNRNDDRINDEDFRLRRRGDLRNSNVRRTGRRNGDRRWRIRRWMWIGSCWFTAFHGLRLGAELRARVGRIKARCARSASAEHCRSECPCNWKVTGVWKGLQHRSTPFERKISVLAVLRTGRHHRLR